MLGMLVEGHGETAAAPVLARRIASACGAVCPAVQVHRLGKSRMMVQGELERALEALSRQVGANSPILVLLDADEGCAVRLAAELHGRATQSHPHVRFSIVVADREYESWFLWAAESLAGRSGLPVTLKAPMAVETIGGAKEWLSRGMGPGASYSETRHQAAFSAQMDLAQARRSRSFVKFEKEIVRLLTAYSALAPPRELPLPTAFLRDCPYGEEDVERADWAD